MNWVSPTQQRLVQQHQDRLARTGGTGIGGVGRRPPGTATPGQSTGGGYGARQQQAERKDDEGKEEDEEGGPADLLAAKKKKKRKRKVFNESMLVSEKGVHTVRMDFPTIPFKGMGHERENLAALMGAYKTWAHQLFPGLCWEDMMTTFEKWSSKAAIRQSLIGLRTKEAILMYGDPLDKSGSGSDSDSDSDAEKTKKRAGGSPGLDAFPRHDDVDSDDDEPIRRRSTAPFRSEDDVWAELEALPSFKRRDGGGGGGGAGAGAAPTPAPAPAPTPAVLPSQPDSAMDALPPDAFDDGFEGGMGGGDEDEEALLDELGL